jgi:hypothetical protein
MSVKTRSGTFAAAEPLVVFTSEWGSIAMGLVAHDVVFVCFVEEISETLGKRCAQRLERLLVGNQRYSVFIDAYSPEGGNLAARAHIVRALLSRRDHIASVVTLARTDRVAVTASFVRTELNVPGIVTTEPSEFDRMLVEAAPYAHERIHPDNCVPASLDSEPPVRHLRLA